MQGRTFSLRLTITRFESVLGTNWRQPSRLKMDCTSGFWCHSACSMHQSLREEDELCASIVHQKLCSIFWWYSIFRDSLLEPERGAWDLEEATSLCISQKVSFHDQPCHFIGVYHLHWRRISRSIQGACGVRLAYTSQHPWISEFPRPCLLLQMLYSQLL